MRFAAFIFAMSISVLFSTSAFAADKFVCTEYDRHYDSLLQTTVVLMPNDKGEIKEGVAFKYSIEVYDGANVTPTLETEGQVLTEDVMFNFQSVDGKTKFHIFMDEMNEAGLEVDGAAKGSYICH